MVPFGPRVSTLGTTYSAAQVQALITARNATERWIWDRLDRNGSYLSDLSPFVAKTGMAPSAQAHLQQALGFSRSVSTTATAAQVPSITHDASRAVHRSAMVDIRGDASINWVSDLIRPHYQILAADGGWIDFPLGVFLTTNPNKDITDAVTWHHMQMADQGQILSDAAFQTQYTVGAGTNYVAAIGAIVNGLVLSAPNGTGPWMIIPDPGLTLPAALTWDAGQTPLQAVNDLLGAIAYNDCWFDELGRLRSEPMGDYVNTSAAFLFDTTSSAGTVAAATLKEALDLPNAYNIVMVSVQDPQRQTITATYVNSNPLSPTSTVNWHPKFRKVTDSTIVNQAVASTYAQRLAQQHARVFSAITMDTTAWPMSQNLDAYGLVLSTADEGTVSYTYLETRWTMYCAPGTVTQHTLQRVVPV